MTPGGDSISGRLPYHQPYLRQLLQIPLHILYQLRAGRGEVAAAAAASASRCGVDSYARCRHSARPKPASHRVAPTQPGTNTPPIHPVQSDPAWKCPFRLQAASESVRACSLPTRYAEEFRIASNTSHYNSRKGGRKQTQRAIYLMVPSHFSSVLMRCSCNASEILKYKTCDRSLAFCESRTVASRFSAPAAKPRRAATMAPLAIPLYYPERNNIFFYFRKSARADKLSLIQ